MFNKTSTYLFILFLISSNISFSQNYNWIKPNQVYLKMYVNDEGMYRINKSDFTNAGVSTNNIDPRTVKVLSKGNQVPIYFFGQDDGVFNDLDYFDFYGARNYGGLTKTYDQNNIVSYVTNEYYNFYSDTNFYWIEWGGNNGLRFSNSNYNATNPFITQFFYDTLHIEKDKIYSQGENVSASDLRFLNTEKFKGEGWYWSLLSHNQSTSDTFSIPLLSAIPQIASLRIFAYSKTRDAQPAFEHILKVSINGNLVATFLANDLNRIDTTVNFSSSLLSNSSVNTVKAEYTTIAGFEGSGQMYFDLFEIKYPKLFKFRDNKFSAAPNPFDTTSKQFKVTGFNPSNALNLYDVNNGIRITNFTNSSDTLQFTAKSNSKLQIINDNIVKKPFRIRQRQVPNYVANTNGADYLIIYHNLFQSSAEQLRAHRETRDNFRSVKADIEDIYDIYNYGIEDPAAVRNFIKYVNDNWQSPKVRYICLFGRGSLDPKKNSDASVYYNNFIPVYGYPPSDGYFANLNIGTFFYYDQLSIGRLPAYYEAEAQTMVNKIIAYENETPAPWWKTFSYITGGGTLNEQSSYQQTSNYELNSFVLPAPVSGDAHRIYRNDDSASVTFNYADSIKNDINGGTSYVNFRGHAGTHDWEVGMRDPNVLNNGNKLPLVLSLTCFTGESSVTDFRGFGEKFIYLNGKGAIGFVSTTGWSYVNDGNSFGIHIIQAIKHDSARRIGDFLRIAGARMSIDSLSFSVRHTINCYSLLGDPAVKFKLPRIPEFVISNEDYSLSEEMPVINEPLTLKIYPKNYGLYADSCKIRFQLKRNNQNYSHKDTVYKAFKYQDTIIYNFKLDSLGVFAMVVTLDQDNWYPLENKDNNSISINIPFKDNSYLPINPVSNSVIFKDSIEFTGLNPNINFQQNSVKVMLELDTSRSFNSPIVKTFMNSNLQGTVTKFKTSIPILTNNKLYYWRTNSIINNDTSGWSKVQTFIYNNGATVKSIGEEDKYINASISVVNSKFDRNQFSIFDLNNTHFTNDGIKLIEENAKLFVRSLGSNAEEASYFSVGNQNVYIDGGVNAGLNMLKVRKLDGNINEFKNLKMTSAASSDSIVNFLNTFDAGHYLMLLNAAYVAGGTTLSASAKSKLRQFGSIYCDSIGLLSYFHTWSLIGFLGATPSQVSEMFDPCCRPAPECVACTHWEQSISTMDVIFKKTSGTVSNVVGPAKTWSNFSWSQMLYPNSNLSFDVIGIDRNGQQTLITSGVSANSFADLTSINALQYPKLNLLARLRIDTIAGYNSPVLNSLKVNYSPASELILDKNSLQTAQQNENLINFSFDYHNAGYNFIPGIIVNVYSGPGITLLLTDTVNSILKYDSTKRYSNSFGKPGFRDSTRIYVYIKPKNNDNEFYEYNNVADFKLSSSPSGAPTVVEAFIDGLKIHNGDYVRKEPEIKIQLTKDLRSALLSDTTQLSLRLNNLYIPYFKDGKLNEELKLSREDKSKPGNNVSLLFYFPEFTNGINRLTIAYKNDLDILDTIVYEVLVSDRLLVRDLYNYPNPMRNETSFMFNLAGSDIPNRFKIKIYTVTGRLIKEIINPVNIGHNQILWDGKDSDGDFVANGTYLYKLITEDETNTETQVQKLVVLR